MTRIVGAALLLLPCLALEQNCSCNPVESKAQGTKGLFQGSTYVFFGRVDSVAPPFLGANETRDQPTVTPLRHFKATFPGGELRGADCGSAVLPGETAVFFVDGYNRIKSCSIGVSGITPQEIQSGVIQLSRHGT